MKEGFYIDKKIYNKYNNLARNRIVGLMDKSSSHSIIRFNGAVAQLGERNVRNVEVEGSIPFRSTNLHSAQANEDFRGIVP